MELGITIFTLVSWLVYIASVVLLFRARRRRRKVTNELEATVTELGAAMKRLEERVAK